MANLSKKTQRRIELREKLKELILETRDIELFKSYQLSNGLAKLLGKHFNSPETRNFIIRATSNVTINKKTGAREVILKPEDFHRTESKIAKTNPLEQKAKESDVVVEDISENINDDKEIAQMKAAELKTYFGDISMAIEYINGERMDLGIEDLVEAKPYTWGKIKNFIKETKKLILKKELNPGKDEEE